MEKVHILQENEAICDERIDDIQDVIVELSNVHKIAFHLNISYIENLIFKALYQNDEKFIFFVENNITLILDYFIKTNLTLLTYMIYFNSSLNESIKKLNTINIEEIIYFMIKDNVIDILRFMYMQ